MGMPNQIEFAAVRTAPVPTPKFQDPAPPLFTTVMPRIHRATLELAARMRFAGLVLVVPRLTLRVLFSSIAMVVCPLVESFYGRDFGDDVVARDNRRNLPSQCHHLARSGCQSSVAGRSGPVRRSHRKLRVTVHGNCCCPCCGASRAERANCKNSLHVERESSRRRGRLRDDDRGQQSTADGQSEGWTRGGDGCFGVLADGFNAIRGPNP